MAKAPTMKVDVNVKVVPESGFSLSDSLARIFWDHVIRPEVLDGGLPHDKWSDLPPDKQALIRGIIEDVQVNWCSPEGRVLVDLDDLRRLLDATPQPDVHYSYARQRLMQAASGTRQPWGS